MLLLVWNLSIIPHVSGQSNYASHANNIGYRGEGLPEEATLDGKVSITFAIPFVQTVYCQYIEIAFGLDYKSSLLYRRIVNLNLK